MNKYKYITPIIIMIMNVFLTIVVIHLLPDDIRPKLSEIKISATEASLKFESGGVVGAMIYIPAQGGGRSTPWIDTHYDIQEGDYAKISASGNVHTDIYKLVVDAKSDTRISEPWSTPAGVHATMLTTPDCDKALVAPGAPFASLIGAIQSGSKEEPDPFYVGVDKEFIAPQSGRLLLTVNDIWFSPEKRARYTYFDTNQRMPKNTKRAFCKENGNKCKI
jgi:hypothetical protein